MKKQILTIAILATLPFGAWAEDPVVVPPEEQQQIKYLQGPRGGRFTQDTNVFYSDDGPLYEIMDISNDDKQHIASTAYVKGAYNYSVAIANRIYGDTMSEFEDVYYLLDNLQNDIQTTQSKKINVYTTWENDNATRLVDLEAAQSGQ